jgi:hypothetical protein
MRYELLWYNIFWTSLSNPDAILLKHYRSRNSTPWTAADNFVLATKSPKRGWLYSPNRGDANRELNPFLCVLCFQDTCTCINLTSSEYYWPHGWHSFFAVGELVHVPRLLRRINLCSTLPRTTWSSSIPSNGVDCWAWLTWLPWVPRIRWCRRLPVSTQALDRQLQAVHMSSWLVT